MTLGLTSAMFTSCNDDDDAVIAVQSIDLNKATMALAIGSSESLQATINPENATDKTITWTSSNNAVATVDNTGKVTAIANDTATITAQVGDKTATCTVTVSAASSSIAWNFSDTSVLGDPEDSYKVFTTVELFDGLTAHAAAHPWYIHIEPTTTTVSGQLWDGYTFTKYLRLGGTGYTPYKPAAGIATRFLKFNVKKACKVTAYGSSATGGSKRPMVLESYNAVYTDTVYCNVNKPTKMEFNYTGAGEDLYLYSGSSAMNLFMVKIDY